MDDLLQEQATIRTGLKRCCKGLINQLGTGHEGRILLIQRGAHGPLARRGKREKERVHSPALSDWHATYSYDTRFMPSRRLVTSAMSVTAYNAQSS